MTRDFVESKIATKFGEFNIRVYAAPRGTETVALWKGDFQSASSVLVRIHSECLTGDAFGGLNCDCGKQLAAALKKINEEGQGVLIYLRQEGRGIGLFDKIKTYLYQQEGYDTSEANVLLGHRPDERTYEMAKKVLDDLNIQRIRILTNNPVKISELANLGIKIEKRIPLVSKPNQHNRKYYITKQEKFNHLLNNKSHNYFYQFHADAPNQIIAISEFLKGEKRDPFLQICVGISANQNTLQNIHEIEKIALLYKVCVSENFTPVLHFSFQNCNVLETLKNIKKEIPFAKRVQLNDLTTNDFIALRKAFEMFSVDFPLCNENFHLIHDESIRNLLKSKKAFILLDNSKGKGIQESKDILIQKVATLLEYGLNDIALYGGFGPDSLDTFFALRRYYHINFSIDAETKLKTDGEIDIDKIKVFLGQLISVQIQKSCDYENDHILTVL